MKFLRRAVLVSLLALPAACGGGGGGGGGSPPPPSPPTPPAGPNITSPSQLFPGTVGVPYAITLTGTGTGTLAWTVTLGLPPTGLSLAANGDYSGTPTFPGSVVFTVTLTDINGTDTQVFSHAILPSKPEAEPNDDWTQATALPSDVTGTGNLGADDIDFWSFSGTVNEVYEIEVFATRRDFSSWQSNVAIPRVTVLGPSLAFLRGIDYFEGSSTGWYGGAHDLDIPRFRAPNSGTFYIMIDHYSAAIAGGDYAVRVTPLSLGTLQVESEGNDSPGAADAITAGTIRAMKDDNNDDYFSFTITEATMVYFEIWAYRNGLHGVGGVPDDDYFDPLIELYGTNGTTLLASNDDVFVYDSALHILLVTAGTYYLRVTESTFTTNGDAEYLFTYTATARSSGLGETEDNGDPSVANPIDYGDTVSGTVEGVVDDFDFFSFSGSAGDVVRIFWFELGTHETATDITDILITTDTPEFITQSVSYSAVDRMNCVRAILPSDGTYYVAAIALGVATDYTFRIELVTGGDFEVEGNDTPATADPFPVSGGVAGVVDVGGDMDVFSFQVIEGEVINFSIHAAAGNFAGFTGFGYMSHNDYGSLLLPDLEILSAAGSVLAATPFAGVDFSGESMTNGVATSGITFQAPSTGTFYVRVTASDSTGSADHLYVLEVD